MDSVLQTQRRTISVYFFLVRLSLSGYGSFSLRLTALDSVPACTICLSVCLPTPPFAATLASC